jgi:hypothetical protein
MEGYLPTQLSFRAQRAIPAAINFRAEGLLEGRSPQGYFTPLNLSAANITRSSFTLNLEYPFTQPDGFEVQIATNSSFSSIAQTFPDVGADLTSLDINGLSRNTRYYVRIRGFNAVGMGLWSTTLQVRTTNR